jgi:carbon-monoxide dehydrogenase medium subunit
MSLIPMMKLRLSAPEHLVDLGRIPDLASILEVKGEIHVGAMATHYAVESSPLIRGKCPLLGETAAAIGDVQVRNMGTIGGSVAHADPSADYPAALQALEARIVTSKGREVAAADFFTDMFATALGEGEIIVKVIVPVEDSGAGTSYQKMPHPASGFAIVGVAARMKKSGGKIAVARIGVTGLANKSHRATAAEKALEGKAGTDAEIQAAAALVTQGADANSDLHASADYRKHLATIYAARAIRSALARTA